jgi:hypothetical protein
MLPVSRTFFYCALFLSSVVLFITFRSSDVRSFTSKIGSNSKHTDKVAQSGLSELCEETKWTDGLWLHCHSRCGPDGASFCGGITNARNRFQTCVRLAIDLGAGVLIPSVTTRAEDDVGNIDAHIACPDHWFDTEYFESEMTRQCPQLQVRMCETSIENSTVVEMPYREDHEQPSHTKTTFRCEVNTELLRRDIIRDEIDSMEPVVINWGDPLFTWNYTRSHENPTVRKDLVNMMENNPSLVEMGQEILSQSELDGNPFFGVHLRAEKDVPASWGPANVQMEHYVNSILNTMEEIEVPVSMVYISCGDQDVIETFRQMLIPHGLTVYDKWSLLEGDTEQIDRLNSFDFDQKGAVDFEVLRSSTYFLGHWKSTMSLLLAYERVMEDDSQKFFEEYIYPESSEPKCCDRTWAENMAMKGDRYTKLFVVDGADYMDIFP